VSTYAPLAAFPTSQSISEAERKQEAMQVIYEHCCGLDVHKKTVVACVVITSPDGQVQKQVRTFATTTASLLALADW
jgi:ribulose bisphosphate carboxylase small subunit